ncbi:MAG TPA: phosphatase PAP2 family protein, partial [Marinobacter sp.]
HILGAALLATVMVWAFKYLTAIPRPHIVLGPPASGAFPSGHTTGITVFSSLAASFIARESRHRWRWRYYLVFSIPIVLVALSRIYLGIHWFTDVVGGVLLGLAIAGLTRASYSRYDNIPLTTDTSLLVAGVAWMLYIIWYITEHWATATLLYGPASG